MLKLKYNAIITYCLSVSIIVLAGFGGASAQDDADLKAAVAKLDYKVSKPTPVTLADWETEWKIVSKRSYLMENKYKVRGAKCGPNLAAATGFAATRRCVSPKFLVEIEEYVIETDATKRMEHIASTPPGPESKLMKPEYDLRDGFRIGSRVYVVSTATYRWVADGTLAAVTKKLQTLVEGAVSK